MKSILISVAIAYALFCLILFFFQRYFLYFPQKAGSVSGVPEVSFERDGQKLSGWIVNPGKDKAILYYGGNAEGVELNVEFFRKATPEYSVYLIPYRGYGNNDGDPIEADLYADALFVYDEIKDNFQAISLFGRSLGTGVATYVAVNRAVEKIILVTPYDSIENVAKSHYRIFPVSLLLTDKHLSIKRAPKISSPTLILIAENDQVIPRKNSENLASAVRKQFLVKKIIERADHNNISFYSNYVKSIRDFLE